MTYIEIISKWGHGRGTAVNAKRPATIYVDDGDGHFSAWAYRGPRANALQAVACRQELADGRCVRAERNWLYIEQAPADLLTEDENGDWHAKTAKYPDILAW